ncbi:MAG: hypothetical protein QM726_13225 [Chitinophagaceae bacterium]
MYLYITLALTSLIAVMCILVKTRQTKFLRLTIAGWCLLFMVIVAFVLNVLTQWQNQKINQLQAINLQQLKKSDSLESIHEKQLLEASLTEQIQKTILDSLKCLAQMNQSDSIIQSQLFLLKNQRKTITGQTSSNNYLLSELETQKKISNSLSYPVDTLYLAAIVNIQLTDSIIRVLNERKKDFVNTENLTSSGTDADFFPDLYRFNPLFFDLLQQMKIGLGNTPGPLYEFAYPRYADTAERGRTLEKNIYMPNDNRPAFANLEYNFKTGLLLLTINKIKSSRITNPDLSSLLSFCDHNNHFYLSFNDPIAKRFIKSAALKFAVLYKNRLKQIQFQEFTTLNSDLTAQRFWNGNKFIEGNVITQLAKGVCSLK